jgi:chromate transporter
MTSPQAPEVTFGEAIRVWTKIGLMSFGGPAGQIAVMHRELVERRKWIGEERFLHALNYCMLLPGPEAQQLATYIGWLMHRTRGGLAAGILFVLPGYLSMLGLCVLYAEFRDLPGIAAVFFGLKAAVLAIVVEAVLRIGRRAIKSRLMVVFAALAFVAIFFFEAPFPLVVVAAGVSGLIGSRLAPSAFPERPTVTAQGEPETVIERMAASGMLDHTQPTLGGAFRVALVCCTLWAAPIVILALVFGRSSVFVEQAVFFSKAAAVTFGGAYAVLAYVAQRAVDFYGWLEPGEMLDGLGLAETTPGPLIMVVQFVAFLGAFRNPGGLSPMLAGTLGATVTVWATFAPCFLWIFLGAPYIEAVRGNRSLHAALSTITAAIVGVVLNLALWFGIHFVFGRIEELHVGVLRVLVPSLASIDGAALVLSALAMLAVFRFKLGLVKTLGASAVLGVAWKLLAVG